MDEHQPLSKADLLGYSRLREGLGAPARKKLDALLSAYPDEQTPRIPLNRALAALYPNLDSLKDPLKSFAQDRKRINEDWAEARVPLSVEIDQSRKAAQATRVCWIAGPDMQSLVTEEQVRKFTGNAAEPDRDTPPQELYVQAPLVACYHPKDAAVLHGFFKELEGHLRARSDIRFPGIWERDQCPAGKNPDAEEAAHIKRAPLVVVFMSIAACGDDEWRARFKTLSVPAIPVRQPRLHEDKHHLEPFAGQKYVSGWPSSKKDREQLLGELEKAIAEALKNPDSPASPTEQEARHWARHVSKHDGKELEESLAHRRKIGSAIEQEKAEGLPARQEILDWLQEPKAPPLLALLGEYGMGKTTLCKWIARDLLRESSTSGYLPLYLDLRHLEPEQVGQPIETVLQHLLKTDGPPGHGLAATALLEFAKRYPCLFIFDGLDEIGARLSNPREAVSLVRQCWRALQIETSRQPVSRLLMSARNHYFRDVSDEIATLGNENRGRTQADSYRTLLLLPFTEQQVEHFLAVRVGKERLPAVLDLIRTTHNLTELSSRPVLLEWISQYLSDLDAESLGEQVHGAASLYRRLIQQSLTRDSVKSAATPEEKQAVLRALAVKLHREGSRGLEVDALENWFLDTAPALSSKLRIRTQSGALDALLVDLRNASLLVREGQNRFRFAHTSLQEFFLAEALVQALQVGRVAEWAVPVVSIETLDFIGQLLGSAETAARQAMVQGLARLRDEYQPQASELALDYALHAQGSSYPAVALAGSQLSGAELSRRRFVGVNLRGANLRGAVLREALFEQADLTDVDFSGAELHRARFVACRMERGQFKSARLAGAEFYDCELNGACFEGGEFRYARWLSCRLAQATGLPAGLPEGWVTACEPVAVNTRSPDRQGVLPCLFDGHQGGINSVDWSPDGLRLASAGDDRTVRVWDADSGAVLATLTGHEGEVWSVSWSPDGLRLASAGVDSTVRLWDADSGAALAMLTGHEGEVWSVSWSPDGLRLASAGEDGTMRVWEADSGAVLATLTGHQSGVNSVNWSPDGLRLASTGDGTVLLWDTVSGAVLTTLAGQESGVWSVSWSPDGLRLANAGEDGAVRVWEAASGTVLATLTGHESGVWSVNWSPDGLRLASAGEDGTVRVWEAASGAVLATLAEHQGWVNSVNWSPDGLRLASAGEDGMVRVWAMDSGAALTTLTGHLVDVWSVSWSPDGRRFASAGENGTVRVWATDSGAALTTLTGHLVDVWSVSWSPDGRRLASAGDGGEVLLWDVDSGAALTTLTGHQGTIWSVSWSPDGLRLTSTGWDGTVRLWKADSGRALAILTGHKGKVRSVNWSPDGLRLASAGDSTVRVWDADSGAVLATFTGHQGWVSNVNWSPDGLHLASAGWDGMVRIWEAANGAVLATLAGHEDEVESVNWSPDGLRLASAGGDRTVRVWDAASGALLATLAGHESRVWSVNWSPDGQHLASAGADGTVRLWDTQSLQCLRIIHTFQTGAWASIDLVAQTIDWLHGDAWRWIGWRGPDPVTGRLEPWPADSFGLIPRR